MRVFRLPKSFCRFSGPPPSRLSPTAREHWRYVSCWQALRRQGLSASQASQDAGVPRPTLCRWLRSLRSHGPRAWTPRTAGLTGAVSPPTLQLRFIMLMSRPLPLPSLTNFHVKRVKSC